MKENTMNNPSLFLRTWSWLKGFPSRHKIIATKSPVSVGEASATFDEAGNLIVNTDQDKNGGGSTANQWMQQLAHGAQLAGLCNVCECYVFDSKLGNQYAGYMPKKLIKIALNNHIAANDANWRMTA